MTNRPTAVRRLLPRTISAEAILRSRTGRSVVRSQVPFTAKNVADFLPRPDAIRRAARQFRRLGFEVHESETSLTLIGHPARFERVFQVKLDVRMDEATDQYVVDPKGHPLMIEALAGLVEDIVFPPPPEFLPRRRAKA